MNRRFITALFSILGMLILILDTKTALLGGVEGVRLCVSTLIPSLFPFFVLSMLLTSSVTGFHTSSRGVYFLVGLLGGYPVGARNIAYACVSGRLDKAQGSRLLAFCNNGGPAFLFGMGMHLFDDLRLCLLLWVIHMLSAGFVAALTPLQDTRGSQITPSDPISLSDAVQASLKTMALVCGWVVLFRVLLAILSKWWLWMLPNLGSSMVFGLFELSNGLLTLGQIQPIGLRLTLFSAYLSCGGICVALQTYSVIRGSGVDFGRYLPGKITQTAVSVLLSTICQFFLPPDQRFFPGAAVLILATGICACYRSSWKKTKISLAFGRRLLYN